MKNFTKLFALASTIILAAGLFMGCGKKKLTENVEIMYWEQEDGNFQGLLDEISREFEKQNPKIKIKRTHYETEDLRKNFVSASQAEGGPDIVLGPNDNLGVFVPAGLVVPVDEVVDSDLINQLDTKALEAAKYYGKQYMLPDRNGNELVLLYNKKLVPTPPKTFADLIKISKDLKKKNKVSYGLVFNLVEPFFTIPFLGAFGGRVFDDVSADKPQPTLNTEAVTKWLTFLKDIQNQGVIPKEADYDVANDLFKKGKAAFIINGPWSFGDYQKAGLDFGIAPIPPINGKWPAPYSAVKGFCIAEHVANDNAKKEAVRRFLAFLMQKDTQLRMAKIHRQLPTNLKALKDKQVTKDPLILGQKEQLDKCIPMPIITEMRAIWDSVKPVQQEVFAGKIKPEAAGAKMQKKAEEGIKALGV
jgi:maltose-binding protein MalE